MLNQGSSLSKEGGHNLYFFDRGIKQAYILWGPQLDQGEWGPSTEKKEKKYIGQTVAHLHPSFRMTKKSGEGKPVSSCSPSKSFLTSTVFLSHCSGSPCLSANGIINETFDVKQIMELVGCAAFKYFIFRREKSVWVRTQIDQRLSQI